MVINWIKDSWKQIIVFVLLMCAIWGMFFLLSYKKEKDDAYKMAETGITSTKEFVRTINCAEEIDRHGVDKVYLAEFELKTEVPGIVYVHFQNGSDTRYGFLHMVEATTEFEKFSIEVKPEVVDLKVEDAYLAFYGEYGSGVIPTVRRVTFKVKE